MDGRLNRRDKAAFSNFSRFEKLWFRDGFVWTVGLTGEIKLRFQIPPVSKSYVFVTDLCGR